MVRTGERDGQNLNKVFGFSEVCFWNFLITLHISKHSAPSFQIEELLLVLNAVGGGQQPAVAQHRGSTHMSHSLEVEADLPGPLALPRCLSSHDARAAVRPYPALWKHTYVQALPPLNSIPQPSVGKCVVNLPQLSSSESSVQSCTPSHSGFILLMQSLFLHWKVNSEHVCSTKAEKRETRAVSVSNSDPQVSFTSKCCLIKDFHENHTFSEVLIWTLLLTFFTFGLIRRITAVIFSIALQILCNTAAIFAGKLPFACFCKTREKSLIYYPPLECLIWPVAILIPELF